MTAPVDHFARFGLPRQYALDRAALDAAHERLTLTHHPDFFVGASDAERQGAERTSAEANEAYRVLRDDTARAAYLLRLLAGDRALDTTALPAGFLQRMFLLQEEVEELGDDSDAARRSELREQAERERAAVLAEREQLFGGLDGDADAPLERLQALQSNLNCERYLLRLLERLDGERED